MVKNILSTILILFAFLSFTSAQENTWSLMDCINYAMENNLTIKQTELNSQYNQNILDQSKMSRFPNVNAAANFTHTFGRSLDYTTYEYTNDQTNGLYGGLSSNTPLFNGFQIKNTIEKNRFNLQASIANTEKIKNDISLNIAAAYLQILFSQELLSSATDQLDITSQQVERTQKLVDAGKLAQGSALEIEAQYASEELNVINADNQLKIAYLNLQQMLDLDYDSAFSILLPDLSVPESSTVLLNVSEVFTLAEQNMPQVKNAEYNLRVSEKDLDIAKGALYPSLDLNARAGSRYNDKAIDPRLDATGAYTFAEQFSDFANADIGLDLSIPIFNRNMMKMNIANARIGIESSQLELQNTKNALYKSIQQAYADAVAALKKFHATEKALLSMEESFKYTEKKYEVGLVNTVDFNTSKNQLTKTQSDLLQAKYDFIFKTKILNFYKGESLTL